jgi:WD40 repeat protein
MIKLWDWEKGWECTRTFQGHTNRVTQLKFNPMDVDSFASASLDGMVKVNLLYIFYFLFICVISSKCLLKKNYMHL